MSTSASLPSASAPARSYPDLHDHIAALREAGLLIEIDREINKDTEMHPLVRWQFRGGIAAEDRRAFLFTNVVDSKGRRFDIPVLVCGLAGNNRIYSIGMGCRIEEVRERWIKAMSHPIKPSLVAAAPCHEIVHSGDALHNGHGLDALPVPISTPGWDNAPYTTSSHFITVDPETGVQNMGNYRGMIKAPDRMGMNPSIELRTGGYMHWTKWKALDKPMPCAVVLGCPPAVSYTAVQKVPEISMTSSRHRRRVSSSQPLNVVGKLADGRPRGAGGGRDRHRGLGVDQVSRARSAVRRIPRPRQPAGIQRRARCHLHHPPPQRDHDVLGQPGDAVGIELHQAARL